MADQILTRHAERHIRQRGLCLPDLALLMESARQVAPDAYLLSRADVAREIARRKHEIQQFERLKDCTVVVDGGTVITCYRAREKAQKRIFRRGKALQ